MNEITYTSAVSDSNTGLYYMNARYYNPENGRFLTQDTYKGSAYEPWTQHLYTYVGNNPVNMIDPTGHFATFTYDSDGAGGRSGKKVKGWNVVDELPSRRKTSSSSSESKINTMSTLPDLITLMDATTNEKLGTDYTLDMILNIKNNYPSSINVRTLLTDAVIAGKSAFPISADLLWRSFQKDDSIYYPNYSKQITNNRYFRDKVSEMLAQLNTPICIGEVVECDFSMSGDKDLYYGIQHVTFKVSGALENDVWKLKANSIDIYDFDNWRSDGSFGSNLNNLGLAGQYYGIVHPFKFSMKFDFELPYK